MPPEYKLSTLGVHYFLSVSHILQILLEFCRVNHTQVYYCYFSNMALTKITDSGDQLNMEVLEQSVYECVLVEIPITKQIEI